jgi:hypothetical protein
MSSQGKEVVAREVVAREVVVNGAWTMARARKPTDQELAEQRSIAEFLADTHARLRLWRKCSAKTCRRVRRCRQEADKCGAGCAGKSWKWVHDVVRTIREGRSRTAAVRAAETGMSDIVERKVHYFGFGNPDHVVFLKDRDGRWTTEDHLRARPRVTHGTQFRRLTGRGSPWLRSVPGRKPEART